MKFFFDTLNTTITSATEHDIDAMIKNNAYDRNHYVLSLTSIQAFIFQHYDPKKNVDTLTLPKPLKFLETKIQDYISSFKPKITFGHTPVQFKDKQDFADFKKRLEIRIDDRGIHGNREQLQLFFDRLNATKTSIPKEDVDTIIEEAKRADGSYHVDIADLQYIALSYLDRSKSIYMLKYSNHFSSLIRPIADLIEQLAPSRYPQEHFTFTGRDEIQRFLGSLNQLGVVPDPKTVATLVTKGKWTPSALQLKLFILEHLDSSQRAPSAPIQAMIKQHGQDVAALVLHTIREASNELDEASKKNSPS